MGFFFVFTWPLSVVGSWVGGHYPLCEHEIPELFSRWSGLAHVEGKQLSNSLQPPGAISNLCQSPFILAEIKLTPRIVPHRFIWSVVFFCFAPVPAFHLMLCCSPPCFHLQPPCADERVPAVLPPEQDARLRPEACHCFVSYPRIWRCQEGVLWKIGNFFIGN